MTDYLAEATSLFNYTRSLRRDFHKFPELGFEEFRTAEIVVKELMSSGINDIKTNVAKTGVVGLLKGVKPGPVVLLRFDMDALPIVEENDTDYISQNPGVMHACGHDGHIAIGLTVAKLLANHINEIFGTVKLVFQPAEESQGGAKLMVEEGVLENPRPDYALGIHIWNEKEINWFGITSGPIMAASEEFKLKVIGKGGHGAFPHQTNDPIYAATQIISILQSIVSRNVNPLDSAVVSIGSIQGGSAFNIIPSDIEIYGTIRTFNSGVREMVLKRICEIIESVSSSLGCVAEIQFYSVADAVVNDPKLTQWIQDISRRLFPDAKIDKDFVTMGSEDFSYIKEEVPGCYVFVGSANPEKGLDSKHHNPKFDFDEAALINATALLSEAVSEILS